MRKFFGVAVTSAVVLLTLVGCTGDPEPAPTEPTGQQVEVAETYEAAVDDIFNQNIPVNELEQLNIDYVLSLGEQGNDYAAGVAVLEEVVPSDYVYFADGEPITHLTQLSKVLTYMLMNTVQDPVSVKVDPSTVKIDEATGTATIPHTGTTFTSENDDTTNLGTVLNDSENAAEKEVSLFLTDDGWKIDMTTFVPSVDVTGGA